MKDDFELDASLFMHARNAIGRDECRYYLSGVFVEPIDGGGAYLVATDGRALLAARDDAAVAPRRAVIQMTMPEDEGFGFDTGVLARMTGGHPVSLHSMGEGQAFQILFSRNERITGLIMPCDMTAMGASQMLLAEIVKNADTGAA